ncbi:MAG: oligopeptidase B [Ignavibacteria bacterium GWA2_54_16]|nr:MAG: oligopeptidase B [Ignavibacteria bacterium GWA2_54_16]
MQPAVPPIARKIPKVDKIHGDVRTDNYYWLREKTNPEVIAYLEAENSYTEAMTKDLEGLRKKIYDEILGHIKQTDLSVPYRLGEYWYYTRMEEGKQYPIHCRKKGSMEGAEQVTLDLNDLAKGHKFLGLGLYEVSDDGNLLAYSLDTTGFRQYQLSLKDLRTGALLPDYVGQVNSAAWAADNKTLFYVKEDAAKRPYRLFRHMLGGSKDAMLYEEPDELYRVGVDRTSDKYYILFQTSSSITDETRILRSDDPNGTFKMLYARDIGHEYSVDHREGVFYIRTNKGAKNFRLVAVTDSDPRQSNWKELLAHRPKVKLESVLLFKHFDVFVERENALIRFVVSDLRSGAKKEVAFPEPVYSAGTGANPEFDTKMFRYSYQSFTTPGSVYDFDMDGGTSTLLKRTEVLGDYDPKRYTSERVYAKAPDGAMVPVSLVYRVGTTLDGKSPLLLSGYGSYGISQSASFSVPRLSLLDRGVIFALAHIRGGGDLGEDWRDDGKMLKKKNTFIDFIACAEHLIKQHYTSPQRLAIQGGSAGGLLIGAVVNMRPDLFKVAHLAVPFVDVINTMLDETLPLTVGEFLEWGNPKMKDEYDYLKSYCPYTNIEAKTYPVLLITTSLNDSQVMYWEPAKYTAKMRAMRSDKVPLLLKTNMGAGHGGASGRYDAFKEQAFNYAFILSQLGITE